MKMRNGKRMAGLFTAVLAVGAVASALAGCRVYRAEAAGNSGTVSIHKMGGDIDVADAPDGATLETMGGNVRLGNVAGHAKLHTMGGNVTVERAHASIDASTMGGSVRIEDTNGSITASTMGGDVSAREVGSSSERRDIHLSSMSGTITLVVPQDFPMEIHIKLAYTKNHEGQCRIIDKLGLKQQETQDWDTSHGSPRKVIRADGQTGNGLNKVTLETINGDVILKQE